MARVLTRPMSGWSISLPQMSLLEYGYIVFALVMRLVSEPTANLSFVALALYALTGRAQAIKALALLWLFIMLSPGIGAEASAAHIGRFLVIGSAAASVILRSRLSRGDPSANTLVFVTILLGGLFVVHSLLFSRVPTVSVLKALSWTVAVTTLFGAWMGLDDEGRERTAREVFGGLTLLMIMSLPLIVMPLGYLRNDTGFQGVLNHPQVFGSTMAILGTWAASQLLGQRRPSWRIVVLTAICLVLVYLSEARTAGLALVLGVAVAVVAVPLFSGRRLLALAPGLKSRRFALVASVSFVGVILAGSDIAERVDDYLSKGTSAETLTEAYYMSRGHKMAEMWSNIQARPMQGIGLGIASNSWQMEIKRDPVFGLPVSASVEKGVMPLAVIEELGIPVFVAVILWLFVLLRRSARENISCLAVVCTVLLLNMGESTLLSPGGMGMLTLVLLAWAVTGQRRIGGEHVT